MKKSVILAVILLFPLCIEAQQEENNHSAVSRNLEIFNDIYKQLDLYYVDSLSADTVIGWGISSMLHRVTIILRMTRNFVRWPQESMRE